MNVINKDVCESVMESLRSKAISNPFPSLRVPFFCNITTTQKVLCKLACTKQKESVLCAPLPHQDKRMFIFGLGYVGLALARHLQTHSWDVSGTCSHEERRVALQETGFHAFLFNSDEGEQLTEEGLLALQNATHMVATIPPVADFDKDPVLSIYKEQLSQIARNLNLQWIGYLSSTGVYGDYQGEWVDENSQTKPMDKRGVARLEAENEWLQVGVESGACVQLFRLGGIYGPGRSAINTLLGSGMKSSKQRKRESRRYTSRIHVSDICQVVMASIQSPCPGKIYNVVDDDPASRSEVFSYAKSLIYEKWPHMKHLVEQTNFKASNVEEVHKLICRPEKRVLNTRLKDDLKVELMYPSYRSGVKAVIDEMT